MPDDAGMLGDLPRSRPGTRSERRPPRQEAPPASTPPAPGPPAGELASQALRAAGGAAEAGLKVASRVTAEVLRRLPRR